MPVLAGGKIVGRVDPGRTGTTLVAKRVSGESGSATQIARALVEAARWVGCDDVQVLEARPASLKTELRAALRARRRRPSRSAGASRGRARRRRRPSRGVCR